MSGCNCGNNCGDSGQLSSVQEQLSDLQSAFDTMSFSLQAFIKGHPILMIQNADDISQFDIGGSNKGIGAWQGWAICDGGAYPNATNTANITTPNLLDKFVVGALGTYAVGDTGGSDTVSLTANQNGLHAHAINQVAHFHGISDSGHIHGVVDPQHSHTGSSLPHTHTGTTANNGDHNHGYAGVLDAIGTGGTGQFALQDPVVLNNTTVNGDHNHSFTTDATTVSVTTNNASTGISVSSAFTGITQTQSDNADITILDSGLGDAHENRPPYYALIFVMKIF